MKLHRCALATAFVALFGCSAPAQPDDTVAQESAVNTLQIAWTSIDGAARGVSAPVVGPGGRVYATFGASGRGESRVAAFDAAGTVVWSATFPDEYAAANGVAATEVGAPVVDENGDVFVQTYACAGAVCESGLRGYSADGTSKFNLALETDDTASLVRVKLGRRAIEIARSAQQVFVHAGQGTLYAVTTAGTVAWTTLAGDFAVDPTGTVIAKRCRIDLDRSYSCALSAVRADGTLKWSIDAPPAAPAFGAKNTRGFGGLGGSDPAPPAPIAFVTAGPDGTAFFADNDGANLSSGVYRVDATGVIASSTRLAGSLAARPLALANGESLTVAGVSTLEASLLAADGSTRWTVAGARGVAYFEPSDSIIIGACSYSHAGVRETCVPDWTGTGAAVVGTDIVIAGAHKDLSGLVNGYGIVRVRTTP